MPNLTEPTVRAPLQARSRRTLARIVAAGWELLREEGPDALTVAAITERSKASVGSFYARFGGKEDLLRHMGEQTLDEALELWNGVLAEGTGAETTGADAEPPAALPPSLAPALQSLVDLYLKGPALRLVRLHGVEDPAPTRLTRLEDVLVEGLVPTLPGAGTRRELAVRMVTATLRDAAAREGGYDSPYPQAEPLAAELLALLEGYLMGGYRVGGYLAGDSAEALPDEESPRAFDASEPPPPLPAPEPVDTPDPFDIWG